MIDFCDKNCSYCREQFKVDSDVVVCPKCGNMYHRSCYEKIGHCNHVKVEQPDNNQKKEDHFEHQKVCFSCGHKNNNNAIFCEKCGAEFLNFKENPISDKKQSSDIPPFFPSFVLDPLNDIEKNSTIDDMKVSDISDYVQSNIPYYLYVFNRLDKYKSNKFNFSAFIFPGGWLLYRKRYLLGSIITFILFMFSIASTYISYAWGSQISREIYSISGIDINSANNISSAQIYNAINQLEPMKVFLFFLPAMLTLIKYLIMFIIGLNANKMYFKYIKGQLKRIKETSKTDIEYKKNLKMHGGVNMPLGICFFICYLIVNLLPQFLVM